MVFHKSTDSKHRQHDECKKPLKPNHTILHHTAANLHIIFELYKSTAFLYHQQYISILMRQLCQASSYLLHFHDFAATNEAEKEDKTWKLAKNFVPLHQKQDLFTF